MKRCLVTLLFACASASALSVPAFSQGPGLGSNPWQSDPDWTHDHPFQVTSLSNIAVPGTSATNPFKSFDIIYVDPTTQLMALTSRSSKAVAIYNASDDTVLGMTPAVFAGVGVDNAHSGPNGTVIAGYQLWAGDYPSTVRVFDLRTSLTSPTEIAAINTGGTLRADEMDYDPKDGLVAVTNGDVQAGGGNPQFVTLISTKSLAIIKKVVFDGSNGTPDASQGGIGSVLYDTKTGKFLVSIPQVGSDATTGAVAEMDPRTGAITQVFSGINNCMAAGMAEGPGDNVLVGCDPGFPAPDPTTFAPRTYIINGRTGAIVSTITQVGGEDSAWYNPGDHHYYTGSRDFFTSPTATSATPVMGVIDADTNQWVENIPTGTNAHSVAANPRNNHIFVPLENPNTMCGALPGCVEVFKSSYGNGNGNGSGNGNGNGGGGRQ
jgi:hypothetical protein